MPASVSAWKPSSAWSGNNSGYWFIRKLDGSYSDSFRWGLPDRGDIPAVGNFDGDGLADPIAFRPVEDR